MKSGAQTSVTTAEPYELYDALSATEQEVFDLIGSLGFRPDKNDDGKWIGLALAGDDILGPVKKLSQLAEAAQKHVASNGVHIPAAADEDSETLIEEDTRGNRYLPGTEPIVDKEIAAAAGKYHALKTERVELLAKELDAKDELIGICHTKSELFKPDPDNSNAKIYKVGDLVVRIQNEWKEKITTEIDRKGED
jgi:hypothetical protein